MSWRWTDGGSHGIFHFDVFGCERQLDNSIETTSCTHAQCWPNIVMNGKTGG